MIITNMPFIDVQGNDFTMSAIVWFEFDPKKVSLDTISNFSFENGDIKEMSAPSMRLVGDQMFVQYYIRVTFATPLDYRLFPIDDHKVSLLLINKSVSPDELVYKVRKSQFIFGPQIMAPGWSCVGRDVAYGYVQKHIDVLRENIHPSVVYAFDFKQEGVGLLLVVFLPLLFMFFVAMLSLSLQDYRDNTSITMPLGNVAALITFRFVLQSLLPRVGYLTFADYIYSYVLFVAFFALLVNFALYIRGSDWNPESHLQRIRIYLIVVFYIVFVGLFYYLIFVKR
jgi:hypothetical protein